MVNRNWRLPEGVDELLPPEAWSLEQIRRRVLDVFHTWGFEYVDPPVVEYLDSLLVGISEDMDLQTLKAVDQRSGRMLGVRSDMTSQAVRIDAHSLAAEGVQRLCYAGNVVLANPVATLDSRVPLKAGAELFGTTSVAADAEMVALMLEVLGSVGIADPILVLGHMGIYHLLVDELSLSANQEAELFLAVQRKAEADIERIVASHPLDKILARLPGLMGESEVLTEARACFSDSDLAVTGPVLQAVDALEELADLVRARCPGVRLRFDLAELAGYGYHNGPVFSAYHADQGRALARGGRYDGIGAEFGRARPATGFDLSLKELLSPIKIQPGIWAPWCSDAGKAGALAEQVRLNRTAGEIVVAALSESDRPDPRCNRQFQESAAGWSISELQ